jgi:hypothetical protein
MSPPPADLPLSHDPAPRPPVYARVRRHLTADVREDMLLEAQLLLLVFATGVQDATTFPDYHCFAGNQTGNTVLIAVGAAGVGAGVFSIHNIGISLAAFVLGGWSTGQIGHLAGCRSRWWLLLTSSLQTVLVFVAAALQFRAGVAGMTDDTALGVIALLAFSSGGEVAVARGVQMAEITTAMATAAYVNIAADRRLFVWPNRLRNRRALFLLSLLLGSLVGAITYSRLGSPFALLISAIGKLVVTMAFCFNKEVEEGNMSMLEPGHRKT